MHGWVGVSYKSEKKRLHDDTREAVTRGEQSRAEAIRGEKKRGEKWLYKKKREVDIREGRIRTHQFLHRRFGGLLYPTWRCSPARFCT